MKKILRFKKPKKAQQTGRITNETVAEHRERILAGGRRFKYPVQYARHRLVFNTIIISIVALVLIVVLVWWQLYPQQNSSTFFYRITRVLPVPVAVVDGESVRYSDYLVGYRSQAHYLEFKEGINLGASDAQSQVEFIKRKAMDSAVEDTYAAKLARAEGVSISDKQIDDAITMQRQSRDGTASEETYDAIVLDHFNWTPQEARGVTARKLLRQEVAYTVDDLATKARDQVVSTLATEKDFDKVVQTVNATSPVKTAAGVTLLVPRNNQDGGLAATAAKLKKDEISKPFKSTTGNGYYVVKLLEMDNDSRISYASIKIPLTVFKSRVAKLHSEDKVHEYISIPPEVTQAVQQ